jgi:beta-lactamase regulating signal transducer with metallopeptidase domain
MFYALAITICLAMLFLAMAGTLLLWLPLCRVFKPVIARVANAATPRAAANFLFAVRTLPLFFAAAVTVGFALPAFLRFEPRATSEGLSVKLALLSAAGAFILAAMAIRATRVLRATARMEKRWQEHSRQSLVSGSRVPVYCVDSDSSLLAVTGFFGPRVFVARKVTQALSSDELSAALAHEMAHVNYFDNLRQLALKVTRPPRWFGRLWAGNPAIDDAAWSGASEVAADEAAITSGVSALDLAGALVKIGTMRRDTALGSLVASHLLPEAPVSALEMRVVRLKKALDNPQNRSVRGGHKHLSGLCLIALTVFVYLSCVNMVLPAIHEALEFLVR